MASSLDLEKPPPSPRVAQQSVSTCNFPIGILSPKTCFPTNLVSIGAPERDGLRFALARQSTTSTISGIFLSQSIGSFTLLHARSGGIASIIPIFVIISRVINI
jgi:hypothetical protein